MVFGPFDPDRGNVIIVFTKSCFIYFLFESYGFLCPLETYNFQLAVQ